MHPNTSWYSHIIVTATMLYGFCITSPANAVSVEEIIVFPFSEGLARVCVNGFELCTYINKNGETFIPPSIYGEENFSEGLAVVRINDNYGAIDKTGKIAITPQIQFQHINNFSEGLAGAEVIHGTGWDGGFIDKTGKVVIGPQLPRFWAARKFSEGLGRIFSKEGGGFVDKTGKMVIAFQFKSV